MENNLENKARFIMHYLGQQVFVFDCGTLGNVSDKSLYNVKTGHLLLTPLSAITDEDAIEVAKIRWHSLDRNHPYKNSAKEGHKVVDILRNCAVDNYTMLKMFDYLRSKGYALPYLDASVDDLVSMGWVKLK